MWHSSRSKSMEGSAPNCCFVQGEHFGSRTDVCSSVQHQTKVADPFVWISPLIHSHTSLLLWSFASYSSPIIFGTEHRSSTVSVSVIHGSVTMEWCNRKRYYVHKYINNNRILYRGLVDLQKIWNFITANIHFLEKLIQTINLSQHTYHMCCPVME